MKRIWKHFFLAALLGAGTLAGGPLAGNPRALAAEGPAVPLPGLAGGETLKYKLLWPSGVGLGEAILAVSPVDKGLRFELTVEADLPAHNIIDSFTSLATREGLCSLHYQRKIKEGTKVSDESLEFDQKAHQVHRTSGGQTSSLPIPECARDPLTFFYFFRSQLAAGSTVNPATFYSGPGRSLEIKDAGPETVSPGGRQRRAEKYVVTYRGPNSVTTFEIWVSTDSRREPVLIRLPTPLAVFSAELQ